MNGLATQLPLQTGPDLFDGVDDVLIQDINALLPHVVYAVVIGVLGYVAAQFLSGRVKRAAKALNLNEMVQDSVVGDAMLDDTQRVGDLLAKLTAAYIYLLTLFLIAVELNLGRVAAALNGVVQFLPTAVVALVVIGVGFWLADIVEERVSAAAPEHGARVGELFGLALQVFVYLIAIAVGFGVFAGSSGGAGFAIPIVQAFALGFALAFGLAIGWGAKEYLGDGDEDAAADAN